MNGVDKGSFASVDRKLALSFGAIILALMLVASGVSSLLFLSTNKEEEDRLAVTIALVVDQAISKVSFSGKYHMRLLVEELKAKVPDLDFISVESMDGVVVASSDPSKNGGPIERKEDLELCVESLRLMAPAIAQHDHDGHLVKEVAIPYCGGHDSSIQGIVRIGLKVEAVRRSQIGNLFKLLALVAALTALAICVVFVLSRRFGGRLRALALRLKGIADSAPGVIFQFEIDRAGTVKPVFVSQASEKFFGVPSTPPSEFLNAFSRGLDFELNAALFKSLRTAVDGLQRWEFEGRFDRGSGAAPIYFSFIAQPSRSVSGTTSLSGVLLDITQRKKAELALKSSEEKFSNICDLSPVMIAILRGSDYRIIDANRAFFAKSGRSRAQAVGRNMLELGLYVDPSERDGVIAEICSKGEVLNMEIRIDGAAGQLLTCLFSCARFPQEGEDCLLVVMNDITERKRAEDELLKSRDIFEKVMNSVPLAIFWKRLDGVFLGCNRYFSDAAGLKGPEEVVGKTDYELPWLKVDSDSYRQADKEVIEKGVVMRHLVEPVVRADGARMWVDTSKMPLADEGGRNYAVLGIFEDITERIRAEEERNRLQSQLAQSQKMESVGRLAGGVAHDFNNMLQAIMGYLYLLRAKMPKTPALFECVQEIENAAQRSAELTRQLLAFARKQAVVPKVLDLNKVVSSMMRMLTRLIGENVQLSWAPQDGLSHVKMDPSQVDQILANLVVNARDAIEGNGKITIETANCDFDAEYSKRHPECSAPGSYVMLAVADSGKGMDKEVMEHIFEPFFTTKEQGRGTGLGLSTVFGIVKQNGGFINVYSEPGSGSIFKIFLPAAKEELEERVDAVSSETQRGSETILLVEDEEQILRLGQELLSDCGYAVLATSSPERALDIAAKHPGRIDMLLTDLVMPGMNGKELKTRLDAQRPGLRCLYMSGYTANVIAEHGILEKGVDFIQKPFKMDELAVKVRSILDAPPKR